MMRPLSELVVTEDRGIDKIHEWIRTAENVCEILPPSAQRDKVLLETQVTTRSTMGAIAYETGGILVDKGWLRFLGSGHPRLSRTLNGWNHERAKGFYLVADDAAGGFFAINGGAFGSDVKTSIIGRRIHLTGIRWTLASPIFSRGRSPIDLHSFINLCAGLRGGTT